jgi:hypothetical protein
MHLPAQTQPVQRTIPSHPFARSAVGGAAEGERGVAPSESGVQPSDWLDIVKTVGGVAGPILGSLGI